MGRLFRCKGFKETRYLHSCEAGRDCVAAEDQSRERLASISQTEVAIAERVRDK